MELVMVKSKQPGVIVRHRGNPSFEFKFEDEPIEMMQETAEFIVKNNKGFDIVKPKKSTKKVVEEE